MSDSDIEAVEQSIALAPALSSTDTGAGAGAGGSRMVRRSSIASVGTLGLGLGSNSHDKHGYHDRTGYRYASPGYRENFYDVRHENAETFFLEENWQTL